MKEIIAFLFVVSYVFGQDDGTCYGSSTSWSTYPYIVQLSAPYTSVTHCCEGSIISLDPGIILTAAHCMGCTGTVLVNNDQYSISRFQVHPGYDYGPPTWRSNDIALIFLNGAILTMGAQTVTIPSQEATSGTVRVVGYGMTSTLKTTTMTIIDRNMCQDIVSSILDVVVHIDDSMVCIQQQGVSAICDSEDSGGGGPSHFGDKQYGVASWGFEGCDNGPSVLTNVAHFASWINGYLSDLHAVPDTLPNVNQNELWFEKYIENNMVLTIAISSALLILIGLTICFKFYRCRNTPNGYSRKGIEDESDGETEEIDQEKQPFHDI